MHRLSEFLRYLLVSLWILVAFSATAQTSMSPAVARVAVSVGDATKVSSAGRVESLQVGSLLAAGDRVRTGPDAVAILVFSDEGRISLRSDSELLIRHYEIDPAGVKTRIELELLKGTVRQISGNASRNQPERYRLNTPIAVIGVRGTDFLAKTSGDAVEAFVHEGKIVLVPHAETCGRGAAGCDPVAMISSASGQRYVRLSSAGDVEQRDFRPGELERVFGIDTARVSRPTSATAMARNGTGNEFPMPPGTQFVTDTIFVNQGADGHRLYSAASGGPASSASFSYAAGNDNPGAPVPVVEASQRQLVWGRFSIASALPVNLLVPYAEASLGRHVTVGEIGEYALWRLNPAGPLDASLRGQAAFTLTGSEAVFASASGVTSAEVTRASLLVNFDRSTFAAGVGLRHASAGEAAIDVTGKVNAEGIFVGTNTTDRVAGALSRDGKEAGYLFSKDVTSGTFRGVTLWRK
jgi:hypothetical protein